MLRRIATLPVPGGIAEAVATEQIGL